MTFLRRDPHRSCSGWVLNEIKKGVSRKVTRLRPAVASGTAIGGGLQSVEFPGVARRKRNQGGYLIRGWDGVAGGGNDFAVSV